mmetsp:Transcript_17116/g.54980  ORF Transcript_17116/g.54980 Transcript_17116/m.54980 type:complete len:301 (-) Transcript_17116:67-969(-)
MLRISCGRSLGVKSASAGSMPLGSSAEQSTRSTCSPVKRVLVTRMMPRRRSCADLCDSASGYRAKNFGSAAYMRSSGLAKNASRSCGSSASRNASMRARHSRTKGDRQLVTECVLEEMMCTSKPSSTSSRSASQGSFSSRSTASRIALAQSSEVEGRKRRQLPRSSDRWYSSCCSTRLRTLCRQSAGHMRTSPARSAAVSGSIDSTRSLLFGSSSPATSATMHSNSSTSKNSGVCSRFRSLRDSTQCAARQDTKSSRSELSSRSSTIVLPAPSSKQNRRRSSVGTGVAGSASRSWCMSSA